MGADDIAANAGTYFDPDGDAVTVRASLGNLIAQDGGTWRWEYQPTTEHRSRSLVYITATDSRGLSNQIAFRLITDEAEDAEEE